MNELIALLETFRSCLELQLSIYSELVPLLDREEEVIARFSLSELETVVIEKDQLVRRANAAEERRLACFRKICSLMGYDGRNSLPTFESFLTIFSNYIDNVTNLVDHNTLNTLKTEQIKIVDLSFGYLTYFKENYPRFYRNQKTLERLQDNFAKSFSIFETEANYSDPNAKQKKNKKHNSTLKVRA